MKDINNPGSNSWKRPLKGFSRLAAWAVLIIGLFGLTWAVLGLVDNETYNAAIVPRLLLSLVITLTLAMLMGLVVHFFASWRNFKRLLISLACLGGLVALFYAEEDIRGRLENGQPVAGRLATPGR